MKNLEVKLEEIRVVQVIASGDSGSAQVQQGLTFLL